MLPRFFTRFGHLHSGNIIDSSFIGLIVTVGEKFALCCHFSEYISEVTRDQKVKPVITDLLI